MFTRDNTSLEVDSTRLIHRAIAKQSIRQKAPRPRTDRTTMSTLSLIDAHLQQISLCASSVAELSFPAPKIFTNALLSPHDITALIRDTEAHERALFSVPPPPPAPKAQDPAASINRRNTTFNVNGAAGGPGNAGFGTAGGGANAVRAPRRNTAVAAVLGGDLVERIRRGGGGGAGTGIGYRSEGGNRNEVDVEVLLEGAEKLCNVYPIPGALQRIAQLRQRHARLAESIAYYEQKVEGQAQRLKGQHVPKDYGDDEDEAAEPQAEEQAVSGGEIYMTEEDVENEQAEIKELERKKRMLEERVEGLGKDITGVLR